jgi:hypothetical protein
MLMLEVDVNGDPLPEKIVVTAKPGRAVKHGRTPLGDYDDLEVILSEALAEVAARNEIPVERLYWQETADPDGSGEVSYRLTDLNG